MAMYGSRGLLGWAWCVYAALPNEITLIIDHSNSRDPYILYGKGVLDELRKNFSTIDKVVLGELLPNKIGRALFHRFLLSQTKNALEKYRESFKAEKKMWRQDRLDQIQSAIGQCKPMLGNKSIFSDEIASKLYSFEATVKDFSKGLSK